jgi:hypothetical protein
VPIIKPDQNPRHKEQEKSSSKYLQLVVSLFLKKESIDPYFKIKHKPIQETEYKIKLSTD